MAVEQAAIEALREQVGNVSISPITSPEVSRKAEPPPTPVVELKPLEVTAPTESAPTAPATIAPAATPPATTTTTATPDKAPPADAATAAPTPEVKTAEPISNMLTSFVCCYFDDL